MHNYRFYPVRRVITLEAVITAFNVVYPKDFYFAGEMHDFWEMVCVLDGRVTATADERVHALSGGMLIFHKPLEFHRIWASEGTEPHLLITSFAASGEGMAAFQNGLFLLDQQQIREITELNHRFRRVIELGKAGGDTKEYVWEASQAAALFERFMLALAGGGGRLEEAAPYATDYRKIVQYLNAHCHENLTLERIARACGFSVSSLKRIFRMYNDQGVMRYFNTIKIRCALKMLEEGKSIQEISDRLGYSSPAYFHVVFKRETGMTPRSYTGRKKGS